MRIYRLAAKMAEVEGRIAPPSATSAADPALGLRPRRALSSAQLPAEWTTTTLLRNDFSLNGNYPLIPVSHERGAVHIARPLPLPRSSQIGVEFRGIHPKPSQIGVDFSDLPQFGVG